MRRLPLLAILLLFACSKARSERCKTVCQQETDCAEKNSDDPDSFPYDLDECVAACIGLERDTENKKLVDQHIECAKKAGSDCKALMDCRW